MVKTKQQGFKSIPVPKVGSVHTTVCRWRVLRQLWAVPSLAPEEWSGVRLGQARMETGCQMKRFS